jgi:hypothetical protein
MIQKIRRLKVNKKSNWFLTCGLILVLLPVFVIILNIMKPSPWVAGVVGAFFVISVVVVFVKGRNK